MDLRRRSLIKFTGVGFATSTLGVIGFGPSGEALAAAVHPFKLTATTETRNTCTYCAVACGILVYSAGDRAKNAKSNIIHIEGLASTGATYTLIAWPPLSQAQGRALERSAISRVGRSGGPVSPSVRGLADTHCGKRHRRYGCGGLYRQPTSMPQRRVPGFRETGDHPPGRAIAPAGATNAGHAGGSCLGRFTGGMTACRAAGLKPWKTDHPGPGGRGTASPTMFASRSSSWLSTSLSCRRESSRRASPT
jgi:hypothetical protein